MRHDWQSTGGVLLLAVIWGSAFALTEVALTGYGPVQLVVGRIWLAALVLAGVFVAMRLPVPRGARVWGLLTLLSLLSLILPFTLLAWGQTQVPSNVAAIFISGSPLFVLLLARVALGEAVSPRKWAGFVVGFAGLLVLIGPEAILSLSATGTMGQLACLGAAFSFALSSLVVRKLPADLHPVSATACSQGVAALICGPLAVMVWPFPAMGGAPLVALAVLGLVQTGIAHLLRFYTVRRAGPVFVSIVGYLVPLCAGVLSVTVLGEVLTRQAVIAYALVLVGLLIARARPDRGAG